MSRDEATLAVYDARAGEYGAKFSWSKPYPRLDSFLDALPPGGRVLDLGCGVGTAAAHMIERGFEVLALDASPGMAAEAKTRFGIEVLLEDFDALPGLGKFHGIWAHFSLLHAGEAELPRHLAEIAAALHPGGRVLVGMKSGAGQARDGIGRRYNYISEAELQRLMEAAGLSLVESVTGADEGLDGVVAPWVMVSAHA